MKTSFQFSPARKVTCSFLVGGQNPHIYCTSHPLRKIFDELEQSKFDVVFKCFDQTGQLRSLSRFEYGTDLYITVPRLNTGAISLEYDHHIRDIYVSFSCPLEPEELNIYVQVVDFIAQTLKKFPTYKVNLGTELEFTATTGQPQELLEKCVPFNQAALKTIRREFQDNRAAIACKLGGLCPVYTSDISKHTKDLASFGKFMRQAQKGDFPIPATFKHPTEQASAISISSGKQYMIPTRYFDMVEYCQGELNTLMPPDLVQFEFSSNQLTDEQRVLADKLYNYSSFETLLQQGVFISLCFNEYYCNLNVKNDAFLTKILQALQKLQPEPPTQAPVWKYVYRDSLYHPGEYPMEGCLFYNRNAYISPHLYNNHLGIMVQYLNTKWNQLDFHNLPKKVTEFIAAIEKYLAKKDAIFISYLISKESHPKFGKMFLSFSVETANDCKLIERQVTKLAADHISRNVKINAVTQSDFNRSVSQLVSLPTITEHYQTRTSFIMDRLEANGFALDHTTDLVFSIATHNEEVAQSVVNLCNKEPMFGYLPIHAENKKCVCPQNKEVYYETYLTYHAPLHAVQGIEHELQLLFLSGSCYYLTWTATDPQIGAAIVDKIVVRPARTDFLPLFIETGNPLLIPDEQLDKYAKVVKEYLSLYDYRRKRYRWVMK